MLKPVFRLFPFQGRKRAETTLDVPEETSPVLDVILDTVDDSLQSSFDDTMDSYTAASSEEPEPVELPKKTLAQKRKRPSMPSPPKGRKIPGVLPTNSRRGSAIGRGGRGRGIVSRGPGVRPCVNQPRSSLGRIAAKVKTWVQEKLKGAPTVDDTTQDDEQTDEQDTKDSGSKASKGKTTDPQASGSVTSISQDSPSEIKRKKKRERLSEVDKLRADENKVMGLTEEDFVETGVMRVRQRQREKTAAEDATPNEKSEKRLDMLSEKSEKKKPKDEDVQGADLSFSTKPEIPQTAGKAKTASEKSRKPKEDYETPEVKQEMAEAETSDASSLTGKKKPKSITGKASPALSTSTDVSQPVPSIQKGSHRKPGLRRKAVTSAAVAVGEMGEQKKKDGSAGYLEASEPTDNVDLDSSASSRHSIMDVLQQTIAMRKQLAQDKDQWQGGEDAGTESDTTMSGYTTGGSTPRRYDRQGLFEKFSFKSSVENTESSAVSDTCDTETEKEDGDAGAVATTVGREKIVPRRKGSRKAQKGESDTLTLSDSGTGTKERRTTQRKRKHSMGKELSVGKELQEKPQKGKRTSGASRKLTDAAVEERDDHTSHDGSPQVPDKNIKQSGSRRSLKGQSKKQTADSETLSFTAVDSTPEIVVEPPEESTQDEDQSSDPSRLLSHRRLHPLRRSGRDIYEFYTSSDSELDRGKSVSPNRSGELTPKTDVKPVSKAVRSRSLDEDSSADTAAAVKPREYTFTVSSSGPVKRRVVRRKSLDSKKGTADQQDQKQLSDATPTSGTDALESEKDTSKPASPQNELPSSVEGTTSVELSASVSDTAEVDTAKPDSGMAKSTSENDEGSQKWQRAKAPVGDEVTSESDTATANSDMLQEELLEAEKGSEEQLATERSAEVCDETDKLSETADSITEKLDGTDEQREMTGEGNDLNDQGKVSADMQESPAVEERNLGIVEEDVAPHSGTSPVESNSQTDSHEVTGPSQVGVQEAKDSSSAETETRTLQEEKYASDASAGASVRPSPSYGSHFGFSDSSDADFIVEHVADDAELDVIAELEGDGPDLEVEEEFTDNELEEMKKQEQKSETESAVTDRKAVGTAETSTDTEKKAPDAAASGSDQDRKTNALSKGEEDSVVEEKTMITEAESESTQSVEPKLAASSDVPETEEEGKAATKDVDETFSSDDLELRMETSSTSDAVKSDLETVVPGSGETPQLPQLSQDVSQAVVPAEACPGPSSSQGDPCEVSGSVDATAVKTKGSSAAIRKARGMCQMYQVYSIIMTLNPKKIYFGGGRECSFINTLNMLNKEHNEFPVDIEYFYFVGSVVLVT